LSTGTDTRPAPRPAKGGDGSLPSRQTATAAQRPPALPAEAPSPVPSAIVTDDRGLVCAVSAHLDQLGLDTSPERIGRHWTELFPAFRRLPAYPGSGDDDFVVLIESTRTAFRVTRIQLRGGEDGDAGALLLLRPVEQAGCEAGLMCSLSTLSQIASKVAHEINNPLTTISGWMQIFLADAGPEDPIREQFASIQEELDRISRIVERLVDFAQHPKSETELLDLNELVRNITAFLAYQMQHANVAMETDLSPLVGVVEGNPSELKQVFLNLMLNARHAMPEGGWLRVTTRVSPDGANAEVRFIDTGHGVPAEVQDRVFELHFTTRGDEGGNGIGLALSRGIVERVKGQLELEATSPDGTTFLVRLPLSRTS